MLPQTPASQMTHARSIGGLRHSTSHATFDNLPPSRRSLSGGRASLSVVPDRTDGSAAGNISQIAATDNKFGRSVSATLRFYTRNTKNPSAASWRQLAYPAER